MKAILLSTGSAWMARLLAIALNIVGLPLALDRLGPSRFGLLLVVLSIGSWVGFANIGMGRVVANIIARRRKLSSTFAVTAVSTATTLAALFNIALFVVSTAIFMLVMAYAPLGDTVAANRTEFITSIVSLFFAMSLWFFLSIFEGIDAGRHQLHRLYVFQLGSYALSLILLFVIFPAHPSIPLAAYLLNLGFLLGCMVHALDVIRRNRDLFTSHVTWQPRVVRRLLFSSLDFTIISLGIGILFQLATGLFGMIAGPASVVELGIFMRLMQSYGALVIAFTYPLSNIVASKIKARDFTSAIQTVRISAALLVVGSSIGAITFAIFARDLLSLWLRSAFHVDGLFLIAGALLIVIAPVHFYLTALLIGINETKHAARLQLVSAAAFLPVAYAMFWRWQQSGILLALDIVLMMAIVLMALRLRKHPVLGRVFGRITSIAPDGSLAAAN